MPSNANKERRREQKEPSSKLLRKNKPEKKRKMKSWKMNQNKNETSERHNLIAKILPPNVGLFPNSIDILTFKALEFFLKEQWKSGFYEDSETHEIYLPENIDPADVKDKLLLSGFYMKMTNGP